MNPLFNCTGKLSLSPEELAAAKIEYERDCFMKQVKIGVPVKTLNRLQFAQDMGRFWADENHRQVSAAFSLLSDELQMLVMQTLVAGNVIRSPKLGLFMAVWVNQNLPALTVEENPEEMRSNETA